MPTNDATAAKKTVPTIAVIAVHGVGNQAQFETAREIGDLLQELNVIEAGVKRPAYYPFREQQLRITVRPTIVRDRDQNGAHKSGARGPFAAYVDQMVAKKGERAEPDSLSFEFMREQLRYYHGERPEDTYETIRLEGRRSAQDNVGDRDVHVYELHWTDLSRIKNRLWSIFGEMYQLMFHFSTLGSQTVAAAASMHPNSAAWQHLRRWQDWAGLMLSNVIPSLNLLMFAVVAVLLGLGGFNLLGVRYSAAVTGGVLAGVGVVLWGWTLWKRKRQPFLLWVAPVIAWIFAVGLVTLLAWNWDPQQSITALRGVESLVALGAAGALVYIVASQYDRRRPGVLKLVGWLSMLFAIGPATLYFTPSGGDPIAGFWLREFEVVFGALFLSWCGFYACGATAFIFGIPAVRQLERGAARDLAERSRWTGRIMLALPASVLLPVTALLWALIARGAKAIAGDISYSPALSLLHDRSIHKLKDLSDLLIGGPVERTVPVILVTLLIAFIPGIWGLAPSAYRELFPPKVAADPTGENSARLGQWLTQAFGGLKLSGVLIYACMTLAVPGLVIASLIWGDFGAKAFWSAGLMSGAVAVIVIAAPREFEQIALGFRTILDVALDVDTWLREFPREASPKARICGRYTSLLRYICNWKHPETGARYDSIVIIAHSQGTVISTDLLRFLQWESCGDMRGYDPELVRMSTPTADLPDRIPTALFTLGCPLRQLYALRFPYLYGWVCGSAGADGIGPDPAELGVDLWLNGYRSGDYIGRYLWKSDTDPLLYQPGEAKFTAGPGARSEFCLGQGAHTHYWDETAPATATALDELVRRWLGRSANAAPAGASSPAL